MLVLLPAAAAHAAPAAPAGMSAIAQDATVELAWQAVPGAVSYQVYRGTSLDAITTQVGAPTGTTFTNTSLSNGQTYYYAVKAVGIGTSPASAAAQATPRARSCGSGNVVALENCFPGTTDWKISGSPGVSQGGIEGFATRSSIDAGQAVDLKVNTQDDKPYRIEIYRSGWYDGDQGRLVSVVPNRLGVLQPGCQVPAGDTGLEECSNWSIAATLTTTTGWPSGVYLIRLVRTDNGADHHILLTVRDDDRVPDVTFVVPDSTYQAYNNWGGKSVYDWNSSGDVTVAGTKRAVKVSYDRPYSQDTHDWYTEVDVQNVSWLEREGYDVAYASSVDLHAGIPGLDQRKALISGAHDEYWSKQMRQRATAVRDAGVGLLFTGANAVYWKVRFENGPEGDPDRVMVVYKSTQSGGPDPTGEPTGTWRDPAGANQPENGLFGQQYIGDNDGRYFPLEVSAEQGKNRLWRYTPLAELAAGTSDIVGERLVGWEWDARASNGQEPAGVQAFAASPVNGLILQDAGRVYAPGNATQQSTVFRAASGAWVVATGTNHWSRGLAYNHRNVGEPSSIVMQVTANALQDMGARPTTPANVTVDDIGAPAVSARAPGPDATGVATTSAVTATFDRSIDPSTLNGQTFTLSRSGGAAIQASVRYDEATKTATLNPTVQLDGTTTYTARLTTGVKSWSGHGLASTVTWSFTTRSGSPPTVTSRTPAPGATGIAFSATAKATFDRSIDPATLTTQTFTLTPAGGSPVAAQVSYDDATRTATLNPSAMLNPSTQYTARLSTAVAATDGAPLAEDVAWSFTTQTAPPPFTITGRTPAPLASGVSPAATVRATFSRSVDPATVTSSTFRLENPQGTAVAASVSYDEATKTATLTPSAQLALTTTYTAEVTTGVKAAEDGASLSSAVSWTFTTASSAPPPPAPTALTPSAGATSVAVDGAVRATFDRSLDPATVTSQTFTLTGPSGPPIVAAVAYDDATRTATLTPGAPLAVATQYTARLTTGIRSTTGAPMTSDATWSFTTVDCPCSLFLPSLTPALQGLPTQDGRSGPGPFSYELGVKVRVDSEVQVTALKFFKDAGETGTHVGRLWSSSGTHLASVTYQNETASGWQRQNLPSPVTLQAGQTYVASVGVNSRWVVTLDALANPIVSGPIRTVADGNNGVHSQAAGQFPTQSWRTSNYFVDVVVKGAATPLPVPHVIGQQPADGASNIDPGAPVKATFDVRLDPSTVDAQSFTLTTSGGTAVPATVSYDKPTKTATLTPSEPLSNLVTYVARVSTDVRSEDGVALSSAASWSFTTAADPPPTVTQTSPADGATLVSGLLPVRATFSQALDPATIDGQTFTLEGPGGAAVPATVTYDGATRTATLAPSAALQASTAYTGRLSTGIRNTRGTALPAAVTWSFTTSACPCRLFAPTTTPQHVNLDTRDGRGGTGPWTYEMGVKFRVTQPARLTAIRYYRSPGETGTHVGRLWTGAGSQIASTTFASETADGWQEQAFATPVDLAPGQTYVASVGVNARFVTTGFGLQSERVDGPLRSVADGANGVHSQAAGQFPTSSWTSSNYFVEPVVR